MFLNLLFLLLSVKKELDDRPLALCEYYLSPICKNYSNFVVKELESILRNDICFVVNDNTSSIFRYQVKRKGLSIIKRKNNKLIHEPFTKSHSFYFFIDKEGLVHYSDLLNKGVQVVYFTHNLISPSNFNLLINAYKKIHRYALNTSYYEFNIRTRHCKNFKEYKVSHSYIGTIHNTIYKEKCDKTLELLKDHFTTFFNKNNLLNRPLYEVAKMYQESLLSYLKKLNVIKNCNISHINFPYVFTKDLTQPFKDSILITGGVCFSEFLLNSNDFFKFGTRFIFTYKFQVNGKKILIECVH